MAPKPDTDKMLEKLLPAIRECVKTEIAGLTASVKEVQANVKAAVQEAVNIAVGDLANKFKSVENLTQHVNKMALLSRYESDRLEQYTRRESIRIHGINEKDNENLIEIVCELGKSLKIDCNASSISAVHRIGRRDGPSGRHIICKFISRVTRDEFLKKKKELKTKGSKTFLCEDLTPLRAKLLEQCKKAPGIKGTSVRNGNIACFVTNPNGSQKDDRVFVQTPEDLHKLGVEVDYRALGLQDYVIQIQEVNK
jgi:hypothetical protein